MKYSKDDKEEWFNSDKKNINRNEIDEDEFEKNTLIKYQIDLIIREDNKVKM